MKRKAARAHDYNRLRLQHCLLSFIGMTCIADRGINARDAREACRNVTRARKILEQQRTENPLLHPNELIRYACRNALDESLIDK